MPIYFSAIVCFYLSKLPRVQFCNETCLEVYQNGMSNCSSCKTEVHHSSLGKYCVRFGSDIKQFCSNVCLEDYKKGLKVRS